MATGLLTREAPPWRSIKLTPTHSHRPALGNEDLQERETEGGNQCGSHAGGLGVSVLGRSCGGTAARDPFPNRARRLQTVPVWVISVCTWKRTWISEDANTTWDAPESQGTSTTSLFASPAMSVRIGY